MLDWILRRCPVDAREKAWVETRMLTLSERLGADRLMGAALVLPDNNFLPLPWEAKRDHVRQLLQQLASRMNTPTPELIWNVASSGDEQSNASRDEPGKLSITPQQMADPWPLVIYLFRTLARDQLDPADLRIQSASQFAWCCDLLAVHCGLGVVLAHAYQSEFCSRGGDCCSTGSQARERLPDRMLGYALAIFAWLRQEKRPAWRSWLPPDPLVAFEGGARYLQKTSDSLLTRETIHTAAGSTDGDQILRQLKTGSRSARLAALWELQDVSPNEELIGQVTKCLHDRSPLIREEAAKTLARHPESAESASSAVSELLHDSAPMVRAAAAIAVAAIRCDPQHVIPDLANLLADPERTVVACAAAAVEQFQSEGASAMTALLGALRGAIVRCDYELFDLLTRTLAAIDDDPAARINEYFHDDPELSGQAMRLYDDRSDAGVD
jgi:hypothetical protein